MALGLKIAKAARRRKPYKKTVQAFPYVFTFGNAFFGFIAVISAIEGSITQAATCILLAVLMDAFDGRVARYFGVTSTMGMELDSLCDAVSFCLAPMVIVYSVYETVSYWLIAALTFYLCAGLFRLARFNTIEPAQSMYFFKGLPTTVAAIFIASVIFYRSWLAASVFAPLLAQAWMAFFVVIVAGLMISPFLYPAFKKNNSSRAPYYTLFSSLLFVASLIGLFVDVPVLLGVSVAYMLSGPLNGIMKRARHSQSLKV